MIVSTDGNLYIYDNDNIPIYTTNIFISGMIKLGNKMSNGKYNTKLIEYRWLVVFIPTLLFVLILSMLSTMVCRGCGCQCTKNEEPQYKFIISDASSEDEATDDDYFDQSDPDEELNARSVVN